MKAIIKKWGNSAAFRIPTAILKAAKLSIGQTVEIRADNGRVTVTPLTSNEFDLDKLLAAITPENIHTPVDFGKPVGREAL